MWRSHKSSFTSKNHEISLGLLEVLVVRWEIRQLLSIADVIVILTQGALTNVIILTVEGTTFLIILTGVSLTVYIRLILWE